MSQPNYLLFGVQTTRLGVTKNGPELVAETTELGPNPNLVERWG